MVIKLYYPILNFPAMLAYLVYTDEFVVDKN